MKEGSAEEHARAEQSPFVTELLAGRVNNRGYADYLLRLRVIYAALENAVRSRRDDPMVAAVYDPLLERLPAIEADLKHWNTHGSNEIQSPAAEAYRARIAAASWGGALVAHHYTRYLGDLSGGQAIGKVLNRTFAPGGAGLAMSDSPYAPNLSKTAIELASMRWGWAPTRFAGQSTRSRSRSASTRPCSTSYRTTFRHIGSSRRDRVRAARAR